MSMPFPLHPKDQRNQKERKAIIHSLVSWCGAHIHQDPSCNNALGSPFPSPCMSQTPVSKQWPSNFRTPLALSPESGCRYFCLWAIVWIFPALITSKYRWFLFKYILNLSFYEEYKDWIGLGYKFRKLRKIMFPSSLLGEVSYLLSLSMRIGCIYS